MNGNRGPGTTIRIAAHAVLQPKTVRSYSLAYEIRALFLGTFWCLTTVTSPGGGPQ